MSRVCFITGKKTIFGNSISHSNIKTKRKFMPNLHKLKFWSFKNNKFIKILVSKKGIKIINKYGFDNILSFKEIKNGKKKKN